MAEMTVELVAVERRLWSGKGTFVVAQTTEGEIGIMPGHEPMLGQLVEGGVVSITSTDGEHVGATLDRSTLLQVVSPLVLPASVVAALEGLDTTDLPTLVTGLAQRFPVVTLEAPAEARRVDGPDDLRLLEALTAGGPRPPGPRGT